MCSTPRPKRKVKVKISYSSVGILSSMNSDKRQSFALHANQASDRRIEAQQLKIAEQKRVGKLITNKSAKTNEDQFWRFFSKITSLLSTPFSKLMRKITL